MIVAVVLAIIGILLIIAALLYFTEAAKSLPSVLGTITHPVKRANSHRTLRGVVSLIVGVVALGAGVFAFVWKPKPKSR
jgi:uncharacterized membrane protein HdeD (DUF308 family)